LFLKYISLTKAATPYHAPFHAYTLYHTMHSDEKTHGGTALIIRNSIKHYEIVSTKENICRLFAD